MIFGNKEQANIYFGLCIGHQEISESSQGIEILPRGSWLQIDSNI